MLRIVKTPLSRSDIVDIILYIRARNRSAARLVHQAINNTLAFLADHPGAGRRRDELAAGLRSFPVNRYRNYLVFYRPREDGIEVIRVLHGARNLPKDLRNR